MTKKYDDIIYLPRHISKTRKPMSRIERAAQFSPFAALTGHSAAIKETARTTEERVELDIYMKQEINNKLEFLKNSEKYPEINITYFQQDEKKDGGIYITCESTFRRIDEYEHVIIIDEGTKIPIDEIIDLEGEIFETLYE